MIKIGIPKEIEDSRVAAVPETVEKMIKDGMEVWLETEAGKLSFIANENYSKVGAHIAENSNSLLKEINVLLFVNPTLFTKGQEIKEGLVVIGAIFPFAHPDLIQFFNSKKITSFALDFLPRIARAQSMDILSSMSNLAGYKSVILAAHYLPKIFPMMTTAAGTIRPAKVIVIGAGVAGLQAIATARRLGGVVIGFDTRPITAEQVKSLGAEFVSLETSHETAQDTSGYAKEQSVAFYKKEQDIIAQYAQEADVIITTALIPGKKAPLLITQEMVKAMPPGAVIVDLSAEQGGNCELTEPNKIVVKHEVTIIGLLNLPGTVSINASQLYARNIYGFLKHLGAQLENNQFDLSDEIIKNCLITHEGKSVHPKLNS